MMTRTEQILTFIAEQPGISAARLTLAMNCDMDDLQAELAGLVASGRVRLSNVELPGNGGCMHGYSVNL